MVVQCVAALEGNSPFAPTFSPTPGPDNSTALPTALPTAAPTATLRTTTFVGSAIRLLPFPVLLSSYFPLFVVDRLQN